MTFLAATAVMAASCDKEQPANNSADTVNRGITATIAEPVTKALLDKETNSVSWELGDKIVVDGATYMRVGSTNVFDYYSGGVTTSSARDEAYYPASLYTGGTGYSSAEYALPASYLWDKETGRVDFLPMGGKVFNNAVTFRPLTSLFKVTVTNDYDTDIRLCGLSLSADKPLAGNFTPIFDRVTNDLIGIQFTSNPIKSISVSVKDLTTVMSADEGAELAISLGQGESYSFYVPVPAAEYGAFNMKVSAIINKDGQNVLMYCNSSKTANIACNTGSFYDIAFSANSFEEGVKGSGTADDPFIVDGLKSLNYIKGMVTSDNRAVKEYFCSASYRLDSDITLTQPWTETMAETISGGVSFSGVLDGNGHTIDAGPEASTRPLFWDMSSAVIKNVTLKGNFVHNYGGCPLYSPFFYSAIGRTVLVCVSFKGSESFTTGSGSSIFGAVKGDPHLIGGYAEAKVQGFAEMGDDLRTDIGYNSGTREYQFLMGPTFMANEGFSPYFVEGVAAKINALDAADMTDAKIVRAQTTLDPLATTTDLWDATDEQIIAELNAGIDRWNRTLRTDARISPNDAERFGTTFRYAIVDGQIEIVPSN